MTFQTPYASAYLLIIIGVAALVTFFAYRKSDFASPYHWLLPVLRFLGLVCLGILLLNPVISDRTIEEERPVLLWLQDESESVVLNKDSTELLNTYFDWQAEAISRLQEDFEIVPFGFSEGLTTPTGQFTGDESAIQDVLNEAHRRLEGRNAAGIILATDGIVNSGSLLNPAQVRSLPIHILGLGDSTAYFDIDIVRVLRNDVAFTGNTTPIRVDIESQGRTVPFVNLELNSSTGTVNQRVRLNNGRGSSVFEVTSDSAGIQRYELAVAPEAGEKNVANNKAVTFIEFIEKKKVIHIVSSAPHPDIAALRLPLLNDEANELKLFVESEWRGSASKDADLIVFHNVVPGNDIEEMFEAGRKSILIVTTPEYPYMEWELSADFIRNAPSMDRRADVTPRYDETFSAFQVDERWIAGLNQYPPLNAEIHGEQNSGIWKPVLVASLGSIRTNAPLLSICENGQQRIAWMNGEGWWRWRSHSYAEYRSHQPYDQFIAGLFQWLTTNTREDRLELDYPELIGQGETVQIVARPKDEALNPLSDAEVTLRLYKDSEVVVEQRMSESGTGRYLSNIDGLEKGNYALRVTAKYGDETRSKSGSFFVEDIRLEEMRTRARFFELSGLANQSGGSFAVWNDREEWLERLENIEAKAVLHETISTETLLKKWWPYILILLLFTAEWALRKREGSV